MNTSYFRGRELTDPPDPELFYVIGRTDCVRGEGGRTFNELLGKGYGSMTLPLMLAALPDGVIFMHGREYLISRGQQLRPFEIASTTWTPRPVRDLEPEMTRKDWQTWIDDEVKKHAAMIGRYSTT